MIEINLLPEEYRKKKADFGEMLNKYRTLIVPGAGILGSIIVIISLIVIVYPRLQARTMRKLENRWKKIEKDYEEVVNLKKEEKRLQDVADNINQITEGRIIWARRLNDISDSLPSEIQLTDVTAKSEKPKDKPERMVLVISGLVPPYPGERAIGDFIRGLRENQDFVKDFTEIEPPSTETTKEGLKKFIIKCYAATTEPAEKKREPQRKK